ncbi:MAG: tetratricopeptide repeat-containing sensor histidine kinase [Candidatus Kapabacteria bacterium]|nr:tetratricopeptide repeat-containing sensor histidine kinase [Ignavibacteriota bacterium]MCW5885944.1 tetratricopeptide repeat-containing sensor histidine kinase [Candidatus Kapabacteria bacterium]
MKIVLSLFIIICINAVSLYSNQFVDYKEKFDDLLNNNPDSLIFEADLLKKIENEKESPGLFALAELYTGFFYGRKRLSEKAIQQYFKAEQYFLKAGNNEYLGIVYRSIGAAYRHMKDFDKSSHYFAKALEFIPDTNVREKSKVMNHYGDILRDMGRIDSAFHYYHLSLSIADKLDTAVMANNFNNLGDLFMLRNNYDSSAYYFNKSLEWLLPTGEISEAAENYTSLADLNLKHGKSKEAISYITKSIEMLDGRHSDYELYNAYEAAVNIYKELNKKDSLIKYLFNLYELEKITGKLRYQQNISAIEVERSLQAKENEFNLLKKESIFNQLINYLLIIIVVLVIIAGILLWFQIKNKMKENLVLIKQKEEISQAKSELEAAYKDIQQLNATKDKFFSIIAHDLRNPLGSFRDITKTLFDLHDEFSAEERVNFLRLMNESADKVYNLLENLLEWSRTQKGKIDFNPEPFDFHSIVSFNINLLNPAAENKNIKIINNTIENSIIFADPNLINAIVRNLVSNAVKFTDINGEVKIYYEVKDKKALISVEDNGIGMSPGDIEKIFRIDISTTTIGTSNEKGSGLGLILCKEFVEMHGGEIGVVSTIGKGSKFWFTIPIESFPDQT